MNNFENIYAAPTTVAHQDTPTRATFIRKTYYHLAGALAVFTALLFMITSAIESAGKVDAVIEAMFGMGWLLVLGLFMVISWVADSMARKTTSKAMQYAGLGVYTVAEAIIFTPLILVALHYTGGMGGEILTKAALITGFLFAGISFVAFTTKKDFSFLGGILKIGGFIALGMIIVATVWSGLHLGVWFSFIMVAFAGASILYNTSNMIHHYRTDQYVAASLGLFASVALLLWYVIRILISFTSSD